MVSNKKFCGAIWLYTTVIAGSHRLFVYSTTEWRVNEWQTESNTHVLCARVMQIKDQITYRAKA